MRPDEFNKAKSDLARTIEKLLAMSSQIIEDKKNSEKETGGAGRPLKRWRLRRKLLSDQHEFETNCVVVEEEFKKLDSIAAYNSKVEPLKFFFYLVFGICMAIFSIIFIFQVFTYMLVVKNGHYVNAFLNNMLFDIQNSPVFFITIGVFILMGYYVLLCAHKGNVKLGMRFLFISFYPIKEKETFINSFFANCIVMNLYAVAVT